MAGKRKATRKGQLRLGGKGSGSGRTHGTFTLGTTTMKELTSRFIHPDHPIVMGTKFMEAHGIPYTTGVAARVTGSVVGKTPQTAVVSQVVDLSGD